MIGFSRTSFSRPNPLLRRTFVPRQTLGIGSRTYAVPAFANNKFRQAQAVIRRLSWSGPVTVALERSTDGSNWSLLMSWTFAGGAQTGPRGEPVTEHIPSVHLRDALGNVVEQDGQVRLVVSNSASIESEITIRVT